MPIKVVFIVGQLSLGGAEQQLYYLLSGLDRSRFHPVVITLGPSASEPWVQPILSLDIKVYHVGRSFGRPGRILEVMKHLYSEKAKIVHGWDLHTNPYSAVAGRLAGIPLRMGSMRFNYRGMPADRLVRWTGYRGLDVLITNSVTATHQVQEFKLTSTDVRCIPNGISIPEPTNNFERRRLKSELHFSENDMLIGSIGRLDSNKNHAMLLRVFASLSNRWKSLQLVIIGDGPLRSKLAGLAERLGVKSRVSFPGIIPSAARYLPALEVCCLTSYTEGMPNLVMEASAAGIPVVSTICGDTVELIEEGLTGYLVYPDDDKNMATCLELLLGSSVKRDRMGGLGREKMHREFKIETMINRMTSVYDELLARSQVRMATTKVQVS